jgi:hypothetical protein
LAHAEVLEVPNAKALTAGATDITRNAAAVSAADLAAALADEIGRLDDEGRGLQIVASRMARDTRPEFEAWFEAGLLLRRASERLAKITQTLV